MKCPMPPRSSGLFLLSFLHPCFHHSNGTIVTEADRVAL